MPEVDPETGQLGHSINETCTEAEISRQTLYNWIKGGLVPRPSLRKERDKRRKFFSPVEFQAIVRFAKRLHDVPDKQMKLF